MLGAILVAASVVMRLSDPASACPYDPAGAGRGRGGRRVRPGGPGRRSPSRGSGQPEGPGRLQVRRITGEGPSARNRRHPTGPASHQGAATAGAPPGPAPRWRSAAGGGHAGRDGGARSARPPVLKPTNVYSPGGLLDVPRDGRAPGTPGGQGIPEILRTAGPPPPRSPRSTGPGPAPGAPAGERRPGSAGRRAEPGPAVARPGRSSAAASWLPAGDEPGRSRPGAVCPRRPAAACPCHPVITCAPERRRGPAPRCRPARPVPVP